jgi:hypothetical protein
MTKRETIRNDKTEYGWVCQDIKSSQDVISEQRDYLQKLKAQRSVLKRKLKSYGLTEQQIARGKFRW